jgi:predicted small secreted protein
MMNRLFRFVLSLNLLLAAFLLAGCETTSSPGIQQNRAEAAQRIQAEPPGDYFIGHRYFKGSVFKFWGYVRKPGQPWNTAQLVVFNEKQKLSPDREKLSFGSDNNYEYKLFGTFSGQTVYEPASNGFYPEFVLKGYELISTNPPPIFRSQYSDRARASVTRMQIEKPE